MAALTSTRNDRPMRPIHAWISTRDVRDRIGRPSTEARFLLAVHTLCSLLLMFATVSAPSAHAQTPDTLNAAKKRGYLVIGTSGVKQGFSFRSEAGELQGFDIDLGREMARGLYGDPSKVQFVNVGAAERIPSLVSGRIDAIISTLSTFIERAAVIELSLPYCNSDYAAVVRADSSYQKNTDLNGKPVAAREAAELQKLILHAIPQAQFQGYRDDSASFTAFRQGRAEAYMDDQSAELFLLNRFPGEYRILVDQSNPLQRSQYAIGIRQGDQVFLNYVNQSLQWMKIVGALQEMHRRWLGTEELEPAWVRERY